MHIHRRIRRVLAAPADAPDTCGCVAWSAVDRYRRDVILAGLMDWAWLFYKVQLKLLARGDHVAVCELVTLRPGEGRARHVMEEVCTWADCTRLALELSPSGHWGADLARLTAFYHSLGFQPNPEDRGPFMVKEDLIRYPVRGHGHRGRSTSL